MHLRREEGRSRAHRQLAPLPHKPHGRAGRVAVPVPQHIAEPYKKLQCQSAVGFGKENFSYFDTWPANAGRRAADGVRESKPQLLQNLEFEIRRGLCTLHQAYPELCASRHPPVADTQPLHHTSITPPTPSSHTPESPALFILSDPESCEADPAPLPSPSNLPKGDSLNIPHRVVVGLDDPNPPPDTSEEEYHARRVEIFKNVGRVFANNFKTYQEVLRTIMAELQYYTEYVDSVKQAYKKYSQGLLDQLQSARDLLKLEDEKRAEQDLRQKADTNSIRDEYDKLKEEYAATSASIADLHAQIARLTAKLGDSENSNQLLVKRLQRLEYEYRTAIESESREQKLKEAEGKAEEAMRNAGLVETHLKEVLVENKDLKDRVDVLEVKLQAVRGGVEGPKQSKEQEMEVAVLRRRMEQYRQLVEQLRMQGNETPRPDWKDPQISKVAEYTGSTADTVRAMAMQIERLRVEVVSSQRKARQGESGAGTKITSNTLLCTPHAKESRKWFMGLGSEPNVPSFLRHVGRVPNTKMTKRHAESFVKRFWRERTTCLENVTIASHFESMAKREAGGMVQFAYNLIATLQTHANDPDCGLFLRILFGEVEEAVWRAQSKAIRAFKDLVAKHDTENGCQGCISKETLLMLVMKGFPLKSAEQLKEIEEALTRDMINLSLPADGLSWAALFHEDEDMNEGRFIETLRFQELLDRGAYQEEIEEALLEEDTAGLGLDPQQVAGIWWHIDIGVPTKVMDAYLTKAFGIPLSEIRLDPHIDPLPPEPEGRASVYASYPNCPVSDIIRKLSSGALIRYSAHYQPEDQ